MTTVKNVDHSITLEDFKEGFSFLTGDYYQNVDHSITLEDFEEGFSFLTGDYYQNVDYPLTLEGCAEGKKKGERESCGSVGRG